MRKDLLSSISALIPAFLIGSCCLGPTIFILFGVSLGSLGFFVPLVKYKLLFILFALSFLSYSFYQLYLSKNRISTNCKDGLCDIKGYSTKKINKIIFWICTTIFLVSMIYPFLIVKFF
jgi:mercuric ion transport protein